MGAGFDEGADTGLYLSETEAQVAPKDPEAFKSTVNRLLQD